MRQFADVVFQLRPGFGPADAQPVIDRDELVEEERVDPQPLIVGMDGHEQHFGLVLAPPGHGAEQVEPTEGEQPSPALLQGEAEAAAIRAKGDAEAEALSKKADAMKKYGEAAILEMLVNILPDMAKAVAEPLSSIDEVKIIGANGDGVSNVSGNVPLVLAQTMEAVKEATGVDMTEIIRANSYDAKVNRNITVSADSDVADVVGDVAAVALGNGNIGKVDDADASDANDADAAGEPDGADMSNRDDAQPDATIAKK